MGAETRASSDMAALLDGPEQRFSGIDAGDSDPALERGDRAQVVVARDQHRGGFCPRLGAVEHNLNRLTREPQIPITVPSLRVVQSGELRASQRGGEEECHQRGVTAFDRAVAQGVFSFARSGDAEIALSDRPLRNKRRPADGCSQAPRRHCQSALACARSTLFIKRKRPKPVPQPTTTPKILENNTSSAFIVFAEERTGCCYGEAHARPNRSRTRSAGRRSPCHC